MSFMQYITNRKIAGVFTGIGALCFIAVGEYPYAMILLTALMGFFAQEQLSQPLNTTIGVNK